MIYPTANDFQEYLDALFLDALKQRISYIDIKAGELHRQVGDYPQSNHRMPTCCVVMIKNMREGDEILYQPPKGKGATLKIRYQIPR